MRASRSGGSAWEWVGGWVIGNVCGCAGGTRWWCRWVEWSSSAVHQRHIDYSCLVLGTLGLDCSIANVVVIIFLVHGIYNKECFGV